MWVILLDEQKTCGKSDCSRAASTPGIRIWMPSARAGTALRSPVSDANPPGVSRHARVEPWECPEIQIVDNRLNLSDLRRSSGNGRCCRKSSFQYRRNHRVLPVPVPDGLTQLRALARENLGVTEHSSASGNSVAVTRRKSSGKKRLSTRPGSATSTRPEL
jgi:hypothetical protein